MPDAAPVPTAGVRVVPSGRVMVRAIVPGETGLVRDEQGGAVDLADVDHGWPPGVARARTRPPGSALACALPPGMAGCRAAPPGSAVPNTTAETDCPAAVAAPAAVMAAMARWVARAARAARPGGGCARRLDGFGGGRAGAGHVRGAGDVPGRGDRSCAGCGGLGGLGRGCSVDGSRRRRDGRCVATAVARAGAGGCGGGPGAVTLPAAVTDPAAADGPRLRRTRPRSGWRRRRPIRYPPRRLARPGWRRGDGGGSGCRSGGPGADDAARRGDRPGAGSGRDGGLGGRAVADPAPAAADAAPWVAGAGPAVRGGRAGRACGLDGLGGGCAGGCDRGCRGLGGCGGGRACPGSGPLWPPGRRGR